MNRYALVNAQGQVVNVALWDGNAATWQPEPGLIAVPDMTGVDVTWTYANGTFVPPPAPPAVVSSASTLDAQALAAVLIHKGILASADILAASVASAEATQSVVTVSLKS